MGLENRYLQHILDISPGSRKRVSAQSTLALTQNIVDERDTIIDPKIEALVERIRGEYENYNPKKDTSFPTGRSPRAIHLFRQQFGAWMLDETELFALISGRSGDIVDSIPLSTRYSLNNDLHKISRAGLVTVGALRGANIASLLSGSDSLRTTQNLSVRGFVAVQVAFKKFR